MHEFFMAEALKLAEQGRYAVHPNPLVGCVIVKNGQVVGSGFHEKYGSAHAEIVALNIAGEQAKDATVYVNLEPCSHFGKTPPCADALIKAQVKEVFVATVDPNPLVAGKGIEKLRAHGIKVQIGLLEQQARVLNRIFFHYITAKTPYVIGKWAMSLDGKMCVNGADSPALSSETSLSDLHELRHQIPGILIGAGTALKDNPALTVRLSQPVMRHPQRIVVNTKADLPITLRLFDGSLPGKTWLICAESNFKEAIQKFPALTTRVFACPGEQDKINLPVLLTLLGEQGISAILVEGGPTLLRSFLNQNLVNEVITYLTHWIIADLPYKVPLQDTDSKKLGQDIKMTGRLK